MFFHDSDPPTGVSPRAPTRRFGLVLVALALGACASPLEGANHRELDRVGATLAEPPPAPRTEEPEPSFDGSLHGYLAHAFEHSPALRASFEDWRAASHRPGQHRDWPELQLTFGGFVRAVETRVGPQRLRVGAMQWFPWPTQLTARSRAEAIAASAHQRDFEARALDIAASVSRAYWRVWAIDRRREVDRDQIQILEGLSEQVRTRVEVGAASLSDLAQVDLRISRTRDDLASLDLAEREASAELNRAVGTPVNTETPVATRPPPMAGPRATPAQLRQTAAEHPHVLALVIRAEASSARTKAARAARAPKIGVGIDWILTGESTAAMPPPDSGKDPIILTAAIRIPLAAGAHKAAEREAKAQSAAFDARAADARLRLQASVEQTLARIDDDLRRVDLYRHTLVPQAETAYESVLGGYATGNASVSDLLSAQQALLELQQGVYDANARYATNLAELERLVGQPVELATGRDR